ncbi:MAG: hypothetical protein QM820_56790 [Minicystis sp.]
MRVQKGRRTPGASARNRCARALVAGLGAALLTALGCALGPEAGSGCRDDAECDDGFTCRAGACFQATTGGSPPETDGGADVATGETG